MESKKGNPMAQLDGVGLASADRLPGWFESLLVHSGVSSATRRKATGAEKKKLIGVQKVNVFTAPKIKLLQLTFFAKVRF